MYHTNCNISWKALLYTRTVTTHISCNRGSPPCLLHILCNLKVVSVSDTTSSALSPEVHASSVHQNYGGFFPSLTYSSPNEHHLV